MNTLRGSVLDYPQDTLPPDVWDISHSPPTLRSEVREQIEEVLADLDERVGLEYVTSILVTGSITGLNWLPDTDIDVHVYMDPIAPEELIDLMWEVLEDYEDMFVGEHPLTLFPHVDEGEEKRRIKYENAFDFLHDEWVDFNLEATSENPEVEEQRVYDQAVSWARKIDLDLAEAQRDYLDFNFLLRSLKSVSKASRPGVIRRLQKTKIEIENSIGALVKDLDTLQRSRHTAFEEALKDCPGPECVIGKTIKSLNYLPENLVYKVLERYKYIQVLKAVQRTWEDDIAEMFLGANND